MAAGGPCDSFSACADGSVCDSFSGEGTCVTSAAEGAACEPSLSFGACARTDNWCDATDKLCKKFLGVGELRNCLGYAYCSASKCVVRPIKGQACDDSEARCLGDLECENSTCVEPAPDTASCNQSFSWR